MSDIYTPRVYCVVHTCHLLADDEYHWIDGEGNRNVWKLCEWHCQVAVEMVECVGEVIDKGGVDEPSR